MSNWPCKWDERKNDANRKKHGISFEEAQEVFDDRYVQIYYDDLHSDEEDRYISLGKIRRGIIVALMHTDRNGIIRIISARLATSREVKEYEQEWLREQGR